MRALLLIPISKWKDLKDDKEAIQVLEEVYDDDVEELEVLVGLMAEKKIKGFAISETTYVIFQLMATRDSTCACVTVMRKIINLSFVSSSDLINAKLEEHQFYGSKQCLGCKHKFQGKLIHGVVEDKKGTTVATLFEKWDESLHYVIGGNFGKRSLTPEYQTRYNVTQFSITLYEITPRLKWHVIFIECGKYCRNDVSNEAQDTLGSADGVPVQDKEVHFSYISFVSSFYLADLS
ncbi:hypothetical protein JHK86_002302 [Glycine max]|nr:hypothetical protein JHK86_002302 [Glycine max]